MTDAPRSAPEPRSREPQADGPYLLVFTSESSSIFRLPHSGSSTLGRGDEADLRLANEAVAPAHARIVTAPAGDTLTDLESTLGTSLNGERVTGTRPLLPGDALTIGPYTLVFRRPRRAQSRQWVSELSSFLSRLELEIERALRFDRPMTLLAMDLRGHRGAIEKASVNQALEGRTRRIDLAAWDGDARLLVLLPETTVPGAEVVAARALKRIRELVPSARAGIASCPEDGCDAASLLASARSAAESAHDGGTARLAASMTLSIGGQEIIVADPAMSRLFGLVRRLASSDIPVLISGESGSGKEIVATALHAWSARAARPLVVVNCAALPENLVESELFGYERGAFSGALASKPGVIETADGGVVFLDEVGELCPTAQAKLLRVIETKRIQRLGALKDVAVDVRFLSATNRDLEKEVEADRFRLDLFHRLSGTRVFLPPIRDRRQDLAVFAKTFLDEACLRLGREPMAISSEALSVLMEYRWPGNIREVRNVMEEIAATSLDLVLWRDGLPTRIAQTRTQDILPLMVEGANVEAGAPSQTRGFPHLYDEIRDLERKRIREALTASGGVKNRAAELIGVPLRTFLTKLKQHGITLPSPEGEKEEG